MCRSAFASRSLAGGLQRFVLADAGEHVLQPSPLRRVIEHVAEREHRDIAAGGEGGDCREATPVVAMIEAGRAEADMAGKSFGQVASVFSSDVGDWRAALPCPGQSPPAARAISIPAPHSRRSARSRWHSPFLVRRLPVVSSRQSLP